MIAVTGATGAVGSRVVARLDRPRLIVRDAARAPAGADVRVASGYGARDELRSALEGADTVFLIPAAEAADRVEQHRTVVDAAVAAGVERLVYLFFLNAAPDATFTLDGAPEWEVRGWVSSYQAIRDGSFDVVSPSVRELTGREPTSLAEFVGQAA